MPTTPGLEHLPDQGRLPGADREACVLEERLLNPIQLIEPGPGQSAPTGRPPAKAAVVNRLAEATIAHFACHGFSHPTDPSRSMLLLHDWQNTPLTVSDLTALNLDHARLAYLSACSTAQTRNRNLIDEAIHLTTAFQLAGFPHVIGTLWPIDDQIATEIAETFYRQLDNLDTSQAAYALHHTILSMRDKFPITPSLWAAHLHAGA